MSTYDTCPSSIMFVDPVNRRSLDVIERAQFVLCLDSAHSQITSLNPHFKFTDAHCTLVANRCLHGNGSQFNSGNRWFDSAVQVKSQWSIMVLG